MGRAQGEGKCTTRGIVAVIEMPLPVRDYLAKVLPGLADDSIQRTPSAWATQHALAQALHDTNLNYIHMGPLRRISRNSSTVYLL